ncbi:MAG TPA: GNAT family N-acetyltransferase, partial [Candidatus Obscuribacterales bacterium]
RFWSGHAPEPAAVLLAVNPDHQIVGFVELSLRAYAEGCDTSPVACVEGWYVVPTWRRRGVGRSLIEAAAAWGRSQGCTELASDTEVDNDLSRVAHGAIGFAEVGVIRCFRKPL